MRRFSLIAVACGILVSQSHAAHIDFGDFQLTAGIEGQLITNSALQRGTVQHLGGESYRWFGDWEHGGGNWFVEWDLTFTANPSVFGNFAITNTTGDSQSFIFEPTGPVSPAMAAPTEISGSISGTVNDTAGADGATLSSVASNPIYDARIDGVSVRTLLDHPFSVSASPNSTNSFGPASFSGEPGPAANSTISIRHQFSLTAGDSATVSTSFTVIPEPASAAVAMMGTLLLTLRRRRS